jgi:hypothetical protein
VWMQTGMEWTVVTIRRSSQNKQGGIQTNLGLHCAGFVCLALATELGRRALVGGHGRFEKGFRILNRRQSDSAKGSAVAHTCQQGRTCGEQQHTHFLVDKSAM